MELRTLVNAHFKPKPAPQAGVQFRQLLQQLKQAISEYFATLRNAKTFYEFGTTLN